MVKVLNSLLSRIKKYFFSTHCFSHHVWHKVMNHDQSLLANESLDINGATTNLILSTLTINLLTWISSRSVFSVFFCVYLDIFQAVSCCPADNHDSEIRCKLKFKITLPPMLSSQIGFAKHSALVSLS